MNRDEALQAAQAINWEDRARAATALAAIADESLREPLQALLRDREDSAVWSAAVTGLLARNDLLGGSLVFAALAEGNADYCDHAFWDVAASLRGPDVPVPGLAERVLIDGEPAAQVGARLFLNWYQSIDERNAAAQAAESDNFATVSETCPVCGSPITRVALALCDRAEDKSRTCKRVVKCAADGHISWRWSDRPDDPATHDDSLGFVFR